jgi:hypothetical protein
MITVPCGVNMVLLYIFWAAYGRITVLTAYGSGV